jgi:hypothetical protein
MGENKLHTEYFVYGNCLGLFSVRRLDSQEESYSVKLVGYLDRNGSNFKRQAPRTIKMI